MPTSARVKRNGNYQKIVEAYVRYVRHWTTIPNVKCEKQLEIDLLAIDPLTLHRYQIETSVCSSQAFSKLTGKSSIRPV